MDAPASHAAASAPMDIDIEHIEVRVLPLPPPARKDPVKATSASLFRFAPPFGLRQS